MDAIETQFHEVKAPDGGTFTLQSGETFGPIKLAYETYGELSAAKDNAILLFHALSGSQHAAGYNEAVPGVGELWTDECKVGWWDDFIGPGKALDTSEFFVVCANYIGGCYGSTGPRSLDPETGKPYGSRFPRVTANDIVDTQMALIDALGIKTLHAVIGGSLGGMLALNSAVRYPERVRNVISIAAGMELTTLQRIHNFEQIFAIEEDAAFNNGDYYETGHPDKGLALARMISHKTFVSLSTMARRARRELVQQDEDLRQYEITHPVESYLLHQGKKFVARFDANTYLRIMGAWQHYDLARDSGLTNRCPFEVCKDQRHLVFSIDSDVCFYPDEQLAIAHTLRKCGIPHQHITVHSGKGHDAFLLEPKLFTPHLVYTLRNKW